MALTRYINYYQDDSGYLRRIPWDTWLNDGSVIGLSPVGIVNNNGIEIDSNGVVTVHTDFLDVADEGDAGKRDSEITQLIIQTDERTLIESYENVIGFYESNFSQTYEFDYDKPAYKES
jgi:hypothetical protein